ncbi:MAG: sigma-70 family RNA polymerase sigma factor [Bacteroidota bacterium]
MTAAPHQDWTRYLTAVALAGGTEAEAPAADVTAFLSLLEQHQKLLYQIIRSNCPDPSAWRDLEQDIILQLWRSYGSFAGRSKPATWIYRIAFNVTVSAFRSSRKRRKREVAPPTERFFQRIPDASEDPLVEERREQLYAAIRQLSMADRSVLLLHLDGHDYPSIAAILGISPSNVGTKLSRLRQRLRTSLNPEKS